LRAASADALSLAALSAGQDRGCVGVLHLAQALAATGVTLPRLYVVTRGAQAVEPDVVGVAQAAVWGLTRVVGHEIPDLRCTLIRPGRRGPSPEAQAALADLHRSGAHVVVARADVADADELAAVLADIDLDLPPLRGVVHAAGVLDDGIALQLTRDRVRGVLAPKVLGGWNLHALTAGRTLDFFFLFSSP